MPLPLPRPHCLGLSILMLLPIQSQLLMQMLVASLFSFIRFTCQLWNNFTVPVFPPSSDLQLFLRGVSRKLITYVTLFSFSFPLLGKVICMFIYLYFLYICIYSYTNKALLFILYKYSLKHFIHTSDLFLHQHRQIDRYIVSDRTR